MKVRIVFDPQFGQPPEIDRTRSAMRAVDLVALAEEQLGKIRAILPSDARNDCRFHFFSQSL
jgi:hypothetical protein